MYHFQICAIWNSTEIEVTLVQYSVPFQIQRAYRRKLCVAILTKKQISRELLSFFINYPEPWKFWPAHRLEIFSICSIFYYIACLSYWWHILFAKKLNRVEQNFKHQARRKIEYQTILEKDWKDIWRQEKERERERANSTNDDTLFVEIFLLYFLLSLFFP